MDKVKLLGVGTTLAGLVGVGLHALPAITSIKNLVTFGYDLPPMILGQSFLEFLSVMLFVLLMVGGFALILGQEWGNGLIRRMTTGLVLISGLTGIGLYLQTVDSQGQGSVSLAWFLLFAHMTVGILWPILFVSLQGSKPLGAQP